jgi:hypothetical protein
MTSFPGWIELPVAAEAAGGVLVGGLDAAS